MPTTDRIAANRSVPQFVRNFPVTLRYVSVERSFGSLLLLSGDASVCLRKVNRLFPTSHRVFAGAWRRDDPAPAALSHSDLILPELISPPRALLQGVAPRRRRYSSPFMRGTSTISPGPTQYRQSRNLCVRRICRISHGSVVHHKGWIARCPLNGQPSRQWQPTWHS